MKKFYINYLELKTIEYSIILIIIKINLNYYYQVINKNVR